MSVEKIVYSKSFNSSLDTLFSFPKVIAIEQEKLQSFKYFILSLDFKELDVREKAFIGKIIFRIQSSNLITNIIANKISNLRNEFYKNFNTSIQQDNTDEIVEYIVTTDDCESYLIERTSFETNIISYKKICDRLLEIGQVSKFVRLYEAANPEWKSFLLETPTESGCIPKTILLRHADESSLACLLEDNPELFSAKDIIKTGNPSFLRPFIEEASLQEVKKITLCKVILGPNADEMTLALLNINQNRSDIWKVQGALGRSPLFLAVRFLSVSSIKVIIAKCPEDRKSQLWNKDCLGNTIFKEALVYRDEISLFRLFVEGNSKDFWDFSIKRSPLRLFINAKQGDRATYLLSSVSNLLMEIDSNQYLEQRSIKAISVQLLEMIHKKCPPEKKSDLWGRTEEQVNLLHLAAASGEVEFVEFVLKHCPWKMPALLWGNDATGNSPLHYAAFGGNPKVIQLILDKCSPWHKDAMWKPNKHGFEPLHYSLMSQDARSYPYIRSFYKTLTPKQLFMEEDGFQALNLMQLAGMGNSPSNIELVFQEYADKKENNAFMTTLKGVLYSALAMPIQNIELLDTLKRLWVENVDHSDLKISLDHSFEDPEFIRYVRKHSTIFEIDRPEFTSIHMRATKLEKFSLVKAFIETWNQEIDGDSELIFGLKKVSKWLNSQNIREYLSYVPLSFWNKFIERGADFSSIGIHFLNSTNCMNTKESAFFTHVLNAMPKELSRKYFIKQKMLLINFILQCTDLSLLCQFLLSFPEHCRKYIYHKHEEFTPLGAVLHSNLDSVQKKEAISAIVKHCPKQRQYVLWDNVVLMNAIESNNVEITQHLLANCPSQYIHQFMDTERPVFYNFFTNKCSTEMLALIHSYWPEDARPLLAINPDLVATKITKFKVIADISLLIGNRERKEIDFSVIKNLWKESPALSSLYIKLLICDTLFAKIIWDNIEDRAIRLFLNDDQTVRQMLLGATAALFRFCPLEYVKQWVVKYPEEIRKAVNRETRVLYTVNVDVITLLIPFCSATNIKATLDSLDHLYETALKKHVTIDYGTEMAVNASGRYEPTGKTFNRIEASITEAFKKIYYERILKIKWSREHESDIPQQEIKAFLTSLSIIELAAYIHHGYQFAEHLKVQMSLIKHNLFEENQLKIVIPLINEYDFYIPLKSVLDVKFHKIMLLFATNSQKMSYLEKVLSNNLFLEMAFGSCNRIQQLEEKARQLLNKLKETKKYQDRDNIIINLRSINRAINGGVLIKQSFSILKQLKSALLANECSTEVRLETLKKVTKLKKLLAKMQASNATLMAEISMLTLVTEDPDAQRFIDPITQELMRYPVILPGMGTLEENEEPIRVEMPELYNAVAMKNDGLGFVNPYTRVVHPVDQYVVDTVLQAEINAYFVSKKLER